MLTSNLFYFPFARYFFRQHQEEEQKRREDERRRLQREQQEAAGALSADLDLDDFNALDEDDNDAELELKPAAHAESQDSADERDLQLVQKAQEADKRAAIAWKKKAAELQKKLGVLDAQHEEEKRRITEEKDMQYQNLCDSYEAKMTEATMQIDDARAIGYDAGIQESEAIIAAMRQAADEEIERLTAQVDGGDAQLGAGADGARGENMSVLQLKEALSLKVQTLESVTAEKISVETLLLSKDDEIATLRAQLEKVNELLAQNANPSGSTASHSLASEEEMVRVKQQLEEATARASALEAQIVQAPQLTSGGISEDAKKEIELWRMRALKMKKAKELVEAEFQAFKEAQLQKEEGELGVVGTDVQAIAIRISELEKQRDILTAEAGVAFAKGTTEAEAKSRVEIEKLTQQLTEASCKMVLLEDEAFQRGVVAGKSELEVHLHELQDAVERSYDSGYEAASSVSQKEIDLLRTEIAVLRAGEIEITDDSEAEPDVIWSDPVPVLGDVFSDTDAVSNSIDNLHATAGADTWDANASASDDASDAPRDDWGEW